MADPLKTIFALNGCIEADPTNNEDFAMNSWHYLRRSLKIWSDNAKLRYGDGPSDCPALWSYMKSFVVDMATVSDGFRLHSTQSTPLHVSQYML